MERQIPEAVYVLVMGCLPERARFDVVDKMGQAMKPSWKSAPDKARYLAMDRDGTWTWFVSDPQPHPELSIWTDPTYWAQHAGYGEPSDDWLSTKERRSEEDNE